MRGKRWAEENAAAEAKLREAGGNVLEAMREENERLVVALRADWLLPISVRTTRRWTSGPFRTTRPLTRVVNFCSREPWMVRHGRCTRD